MYRREKEIVERELDFAERVRTTCTDEKWSACARTLAAEVRALREQLTTACRAPQLAAEDAEGAMPEVVDAALADVDKYGEPSDYAHVLAAEVRALRATITRVEALPETWRQSTIGIDVDTAEYCIPRDCANELEAALRGPQ